MRKPKSGKDIGAALASGTENQDGNISRERLMQK